jgi:hypothetical protein
LTFCPEPQNDKKIKITTGKVYLPTLLKILFCIMKGLINNDFGAPKLRDFFVLVIGNSFLTNFNLLLGTEIRSIKYTEDARRTKENP